MNTKTRWVLALTGVGSLMAALDTVAVSTALTTIHRSLGATVEQLEWTVNAYNLSFDGGDAALDLRGLALVSGGVLGIVWALVRGNIAGWGSAETIAALAAGIALCAAFLRWETRTPEPMLPLSFFRSRGFSAGNAAIFCTFGSLFACVFFYPQLLQIVLGADPLQAGLKLLPWTAAFITVAPLAGAAADRIGERPLMVAGLSMQAAGTIWLATIAETQLSYSSVLAPFLLAGVGISLAIPAAQNSVVGTVEDRDIGKAAGANSMMRELGGVFGIALAVAVFAGSGGYASPERFIAGFGGAIWVAAVIAAAGAVCALALPSRRLLTAGRLSIGIVEPEEA